MERPTPKIVQHSTTDGALTLVFDEVRTSAPDHGGILSGWQWEGLRGKLLRAGFDPSAVKLLLLEDLRNSGEGTNGIYVGFGESVLRHFTNRRGVDKWHLSRFDVSGGSFIPTFDLGRVNKQYELNLYQEVALHRAREYCVAPPQPPVERFLLNPPLEETYAILAMLTEAEEIAVDVETGYGQINTVGFAWSERDAIAINVLPDRCVDDSYFELWKRIQAVLESPSRKIFQNFIYDTSYFSAYGIKTRGEIFDTMHAMKVLWPELDSNLGNVGRMYTRRPYWKDDGKVESEEGKKKDWGNVRDWTKHYTYNCRDTTGTLESSRRMRADLEARGLAKFYSDYLTRLKGPVREMCATGFPVCGETRDRIAKETEARVESLTKTLQEKAGLKLILCPRCQNFTCFFMRGGLLVLTYFFP